MSSLRTRFTTLLAPLAAVAVLAVAANAGAGELQLRDEAHVFAASDVAHLRAAVASAPFDARVVTTSAYPDQTGLSGYVRTLVSEPDMVVVGIDPEHHHVQVHFGTGSHVPRAAWSSIERSGNDAFKQGAWEQGAETIVRAAANNVAATATPSPTASAPEGTRTSFMGPLLLLLVIGGVIGAVVFLARRRAGAGGYGPGSYAGGGPYGGAGGPYYGPAPQAGSGMGALGGGLIGAGLGGLAGYELGKMEGEREERGRDVPFGGGVREDTTNDGGSFDAGGGGSSWDDAGGGDVGGFDGGDSGGSDF